MNATSAPATPPGLAARLAAFAAGCRDGVPEEVTADATGRILDFLGNCLAALGPDTGERDEAAPHRAALRTARRSGGHPEAGVIGTGDRFPADRAALVNGTLAHALDFDDTHLPSVLHPTAAVLPAALAVAEAEGADGAALTAALAAGGEICVRLGMASYDPALRNSVFFERGLHATSICGTVGAAVASAVLLGLSAEGIADAIGIACSMGAGVIEANRTGGSVKRVHCGWAAHCGVTAAQLAAEGVTGPPTVIEGRFGFLTAFLGDQWHAEPLTEGLDAMHDTANWQYLRTVYKPYPSNHFTHPGIDCALALRARGLDPDTIATAELGVAGAPRRTIGEPREEKVRPRTPYHAKFSGPYTVAAALLAGENSGLGLHLADFSPGAFEDPRRRALAARVEVVRDAVCDDEFPHAFSAVLRVTTQDGTRWEHRVPGSRGGPAAPLTPEELETKYRLGAEPVLGAGRAQQLAAYVRVLPGAGKGCARELVDGCRPEVPDPPEVPEPSRG
ncbi:MmgE/PrpD family protein [Streptomyces poriferorum]|uniref:MmgE/PrpD family protein n=1 Tax=Streptomyces poriferorum TaxID=2798799 RepID=A0ABY9IL92_9ACTN|nr:MULTISPECIES: MmgE/PrpD family protein [unclassified Streptomyces]MDP5316882.1 MmgE/PrpD family protein [Streptomyces sp. Alt4]WLQ55169.1 MmgE/PrpD family protein [Streptomyces sp. Alt2]